MSSFCSNCGSRINEGDRVCGNCGTLIASAPVSGRPILSAPTQKKSKSKIIVLIGAAVFLIVVAVIAVNVVGSFAGYKGTIRKMVKALQNDDMVKLKSLTSSVSDEIYGRHCPDVSEWNQNRVSETLDKYEDNVGVIKKISFKISDTTELSARRVKDVKDLLVRDYNVDVSGIKKIMEVEMTLTVKGSKKSASYRVKHLYMIKEKGGWKLYYGSLGY